MSFTMKKKKNNKNLCCYCYSILPGSVLQISVAFAVRRQDAYEFRISCRTISIQHDPTIEIYFE